MSFAVSILFLCVCGKFHEKPRIFTKKNLLLEILILLTLSFVYNLFFSKSIILIAQFKTRSQLNAN